MTKIRTAKQKGSQFEYSCMDSLKQISPDILLMKQLGFVSGYDLVSHTEKRVWECKRHKAFSWNELMGYFLKLEKNASEGYSSYLLFKANHQPCLVMFRSLHYNNQVFVTNFEDYYEIKFIEHKK